MLVEGRRDSSGGPSEWQTLVSLLIEKCPHCAVSQTCPEQRRRNDNCKDHFYRAGSFYLTIPYHSVVIDGYGNGNAGLWL